MLPPLLLLLLLPPELLDELELLELEELEELELLELEELELDEVEPAVRPGVITSYSIHYTKLYDYSWLNPGCKKTLTPCSLPFNFTYRALNWKKPFLPPPMRFPDTDKQ